jgi:hypothetical protein
MALILEQTLVNADIVRYHRICKYQLNQPGAPAVAVLESFRTADQRALPITPVIKRDYDFIWSGSGETLAAEAYAAIKALPEWALAVDG